MSEERKKPTVAFWITVALVAVLVGYPLSMGPAIWLCNQEWSRELRNWASLAYPRVYAPIIWLYDNGPRPIRDAIFWYANIGW